MPSVFSLQPSAFYPGVPVPFRYRLLLIVSLVVLVVDQLTKFYIDHRFALYESVTEIGRASCRERV